MRINVQKDVPDLDLDLMYEDVDMTALSNFLAAKAGVNVERGVLNLDSEPAVAFGGVAGKPISQEIKLLDISENKTALILLWENMVCALPDVFKNEHIQFATREPVMGAKITLMLQSGTFFAMLLRALHLSATDRHSKT